MRDPRVRERGERIGRLREVSTGCGAGDVTAPWGVLGVLVGSWAWWGLLLAGGAHDSQINRGSKRERRRRGLAGLGGSTGRQG